MELLTTAEVNERMASDLQDLKRLLKLYSADTVRDFISLILLEDRYGPEIVKTMAEAVNRIRSSRWMGSRL